MDFQFLYETLKGDKMKKFICLIMILAMAFSVAGCSAVQSEEVSLPKGHAIKIEYVSGGSSSNVEFEFVTETLVKVRYEDPKMKDLVDFDYRLIPTSNIESIQVKE